MNPISNPFAKLKIRTLVMFLILGFPILVVALWTSKKILGFNDALIESFGATIWFYGTVLLWMWYQFRRQKISWKQLIGSFPNHINWFSSAGLLVCLLLFNFGSLLFSLGLISFLFPDFVLSFLNEQRNTQSFNPAIFLIFDTISAIIIAPIVEELLMRGVFLHRFQIKWGIHKAIIIGALIFAIGHSNIIGMFMVALVLSLLYLKYKTLIVPMIFHALNNTAVSLLMLSSSGNEPKTATSADFQPVLWIGLVLVIISAPVLVRFLIKNWPKKGELVMPYFANSTPV